MTCAFTAMQFALKVHTGQTRKYVGTPYSDHLAEVAGIVATVSRDPNDIAIAWLHDCVEDSNILYMELRELFGKEIAAGVLMLSDLEEGNRRERKEQSCRRLALAPANIQTIKCADLISNTRSIVDHDPNFAAVYLREKQALLAVMTAADRRLHGLATQIAEASLEKLALLREKTVSADCNASF